MEKGKTKYLLKIRNLKREYCTHTSNGEDRIYPVLKGLSFDVLKGDFIGVMGSSGCGKTTLLKTIGLLDKPNGGHIIYNGTDTKEIYGDKLSAIRRTEVAFIFQDFYLMDSLNVEENIVLPMVLNENDVEESITKARKTAKRFGIESLLEKKPSELSGGEKQRVAICRAVAINPELILADEPTGNLDSKASANVIQTLANINAKMGKTVLLVSHDPKVASYCKKIILLKDGLILDVLERTDTQSEFYHRILDNMDRL